MGTWWTTCRILLVYVSAVSLTLFVLVKFHAFCSLLIFFQNYFFFKKNLLGTLVECQMVCTDLGPNWLSAVDELTTLDYNMCMCYFSADRLLCQCRCHFLSLLNHRDSDVPYWMY